MHPSDKLESSVPSSDKSESLVPSSDLLLEGGSPPMCFCSHAPRQECACTTSNSQQLYYVPAAERQRCGTPNRLEPHIALLEWGPQGRSLGQDVLAVSSCPIAAKASHHGDTQEQCLWQESEKTMPTLSKYLPMCVRRCASSRKRPWGASAAYSHLPGPGD